SPAVLTAGYPAPNPPVAPGLPSDIVILFPVEESQPMGIGVREREFGLPSRRRRALQSGGRVERRELVWASSVAIASRGFPPRPAGGNAQPLSGSAGAPATLPVRPPRAAGHRSGSRTPGSCG